MTKQRQQVFETRAHGTLHYGGPTQNVYSGTLYRFSEADTQLTIFMFMPLNGSKMKLLVC